jgi:hypothetical protein
MTRRLAAAASVIVTAMTAMSLAVTPQPVSVSASEDVVRQLCAAFNTQEAAALVAHVSDDVSEGSQAGTAKGDSSVAMEGRVKDRSTHGVVVMGIQHAFDRIAAGQPMPEVFEVMSVASVGQAIDDLILLAECSVDGEWEGQGQVRFLPL